MRGGLSILLSCLFLACGPDRELLSEAKFDAALREKARSLSASEQSEILAIAGKCTTVIDGLMRADLVSAGAEIRVMKGDSFEAMVSSDDLFDVAAVEFVTELKLLKK